jgi:SAM-dependent methyltransferase
MTDHPVAAPGLLAKKFHAEAHAKLLEHRKVWANNAVLRQVYANYYARIRTALPGHAVDVLEVGGGIGQFKAAVPQAVSTDIVWNSWVDIVADAQCLPVRDASLDAVVLVDVLHHLETPLEFFAETIRALRPGGRVIILDVYISPLSWLVLKLFHPEPVDLSEDFWERRLEQGLDRDPWDANQAMATLFFWRQLDRFRTAFPELEMVSREHFDWCWPLSGGFSYRPFIPDSQKHWLGPMSKFAPLNSIAAFRSFIVLERK